jgi:Skp family chaperone for outer membrane proteins
MPTMKLRILILGFWLTGGLFAAQGQAITRGTIVFADYEQVLTNYFKAKLANDQLQQMLESFNRERAILLIQFDKYQEELKELRGGILKENLEPAEKEKIRKDIDAKLIEVRKHEERIASFNEIQTKRWEEQNRRIRGTLMEEIAEKLAALMKARGYLAVFDRSQVNDKGAPSVLYLDPQADITADLIAEVNK